MEIAFEFRLAQILVSRQSELSEEDDQSTPTDDFVFQDVRREQAQPDPEAARTGDEEPKSLSDFPDSESRRTEAASLPPLSVPTNIDLSGESRDVDWLNYAEYTTIDPFSDVQIARYISPVFLDFNGDGFLDLVTGTAFGNLLIYQGRADGTYAPWEGESPFSQVQVANFSAPAFADLDGDGDLDLAVGAQDGTVTAYRNGGFGWSGAFTPSSSGYPLNGIDAGTGAAPVFVDIDHDGDMDMVVGNGAGPLVTYRNGGDGWAGAGRGARTSPLPAYPSMREARLSLSISTGMGISIWWSAPAMARSSPSSTVATGGGGRCGRWANWTRSSTSMWATAAPRPSPISTTTAIWTW